MHFWNTLCRHQSMSSLIRFTDSGMYCPAGDFYIDPWKPVPRALITHGHADHARPGNGLYLAHPLTVEIMKARLGQQAYQSIKWNEPLKINDVRVTYFPSGHIAGGSQIRLEYKGETWVLAGDYKLVNDGISGEFEPVKCDVFVTESTFGLPVYKWQKQEEIYADILNWIYKNKSEGKTSVLIAYSLGKAQRVIQALSKTLETIWAHGAVYNMQQVLIDAGMPLAPVQRITPETSKAELNASVVIAPPGAEGSTWMRRFGNHETGICSGWMQVRGHLRRSKADRGFVLSDHADFNDLVKAVKLTEASKVFVTHGFQAAFSRYLNETLVASEEVKTAYMDDESGTVPGENNENEMEQE